VLLRTDHGPVQFATPIKLFVNILFNDVAPAALVWAIHQARVYELFQLPVSAVIVDRIGTIGLWLSALAAVVANEAFLRRPPFNLWHFFASALAIAMALFPFIAASYDVDWGPSPEAIAIISHYCFLALEVAFGVLIGGSLSLVLRALRPSEYP
jgi:hypothetical protein